MFRGVRLSFLSGLFLPVLESYPEPHVGAPFVSHGGRGCGGRGPGKLQHTPMSTKLTDRQLVQALMFLERHNLVHG